MSITASEARRSLLPLIKRVIDDYDAVEIVSKHGNAVLLSAEHYSALHGSGSISASRGDADDPGAV